MTESVSVRFVIQYIRNSFDQAPRIPASSKHHLLYIIITIQPLSLAAHAVGAGKVF